MKTCLCCGNNLRTTKGAVKYCLKCYFSRANGHQSAIAAVCKAVRKGMLPRASSRVCVDCGAQAAVYDHRDYALPLVVEPVCRRCNFMRGPAIPIRQADPIPGRTA